MVIQTTIKRHGLNRKKIWLGKIMAVCQKLRGAMTPETSHRTPTRQNFKPAHEFQKFKFPRESRKSGIQPKRQMFELPGRARAFSRASQRNYPPPGQ